MFIILRVLEDQLREEWGVLKDNQPGKKGGKY